MQIDGVTIDISKVKMIVKVFVIREADMKRIGFYLIMIIGMMLCWGCGDHKITESTDRGGFAGVQDGTAGYGTDL